jgi:hypothetical protein
MRTISHTIEIKEILVLTGCDEITIVGIVRRNLLSYETQLEIQSTQLNRVINELQKKNPEIEVSGMFQSRSLESGKSFYYLNGLENIDSVIDVETVYHDQMIRQIRA